MAGRKHCEVLDQKELAVFAGANCSGDTGCLSHPRPRELHSCCVERAQRHGGEVLRRRDDYGGLQAEDAKKQKHLDKQNLALRKLLSKAELLII